MLIDIKEKVLNLWKQLIPPKDIAQQLDISYSRVTNYIYRSPEYREFKKTGKMPSLASDYSVANRIGAEVAEGKLFTEEELIEAHGFDPNDFRLKSAVSNNWGIKSDIELMNFQHKIEVLPKSLNPDFEEQLKIISKYNTIFDIECLDDWKIEQTYLLNMADLHLGLNTAEEYEPYQSAVLRDLEEQYKEVILLNLGDFLHVNDFKSRTANDTRINDTEFTNMWEEALLFIDPIIQHALRNSPNVRYVYNRGNHDETSNWAFTQLLKERYPQMEVDDSMDMLKCIQFDEIAIYTTHGHVRKKNFAQLCAALYPLEWSRSKARYLFTGHYHHIKGEDLTGIVHFQQPSPSKATTYEEENLFVGSKQGMYAYTFFSDDLATIRNLR